MIHVLDREFSGFRAWVLLSIFHCHQFWKIWIPNTEQGHKHNTLKRGKMTILLTLTHMEANARISRWIKFVESKLLQAGEKRKWKRRKELPRHCTITLMADKRLNSQPAISKITARLSQMTTIRKRQWRNDTENCRGKSRVKVQLPLTSPYSPSPPPPHRVFYAPLSLF